MTDKVTEAFIREKFAKAYLPNALRNEMMRLFLKHHAVVHWDGSETSNLESLLGGHIRNLERISNEALPPYELITKGPGRTFKQYWDEYWQSVDIPEVVYSENRSWDGWYEARFGMGSEFTRRLYDLQVGIAVPDELRTQGHMIMAPPGHGKTNFMENLIMDDVKTGASVIVMDSQEGMINRLLRALPEDRVAYFDAGALEYPLAISAFNLGRTDRLADEIKVSRSMDMFENMFSSMDFKFTTKQSTLFRELCRFLAVIPASGINTAIDILQNGYAPYFQYLHRLSDSTAEFITTHLGVIKRGAPSDYVQTRGEVKTRFQSLSTSPAVQRMLNAPMRKVDVAKEIKSHKIILINTAQSTLSPSGASLVGRYFLMQIILEVLSRPENNDTLKRVCIYIDEAQEYVSSAGLLSLALEQGRKRGMCLTMTFHHLGQLARAADGLPDAVRSLTAIKSVKAANVSDARAIGGDTMIEPTDLQRVPKRSFVLHCRDIGHAVISPPKSELRPRRTEAELQKMIRRMHRKYGYDPRGVQRPKTEIATKPATEPRLSGKTDPDAPQDLD